MPITRQAQKKLRHDLAVTRRNSKKRASMRDFVKSARKSPTAKSISAAFKALDKSAKGHSIHKNKAARLKSRLSKLLKKKK